MLRKQPTAEPCLLPERYGGQAERLWVGSSTGSSATSAMTARLVEGRLISSGRVVVRPNFGFEENEPEFRSTDSVVCVSRLTPEKGVLDLVRNWPQGAGSPSLTVLGDGPQYGEISSISAALDNVTLAGFTFARRCDRDTSRQCGVRGAVSMGRTVRTRCDRIDVGWHPRSSTQPTVHSRTSSDRAERPLHTLEESSIREALDRIFGADDRSAIRRSAYRHYSNRFTSRKGGDVDA